jgi:hypothetical protein
MNLFFTVLVATLLHPMHETVAEVQWNPETHRLEVALRLSVLDQQWIQRNHTESKAAGDADAKGNDASEIKVWAVRYLTRTFQVDPGKSKPVNPPTYRWVGRKEEGAHVWWFFEIQPASKQPPKVLSQRMLFEREQGYVNRVLILGPSAQKKDRTRKDATVPRRSVTLTIQRPTTNLDVKPDDKPDATRR